MQPTGPLEGQACCPSDPHLGPPHPRVRSRGLQQLPPGSGRERRPGPPALQCPHLPWVAVQSRGRAAALSPAWPPPPLPSTPSPPRKGRPLALAAQPSPVITGTRRAETTARPETSPAGWRPLRETAARSTPPARHCPTGSHRTGWQGLVVTRNKPGRVPGQPPRVPAGGRRDRVGPLGSDPSQREAAKQNQRARRPSGGRGGVQGGDQPSFQNPVPRTHTDPQRHMSQGSLSQTQSRDSYRAGPAGPSAGQTLNPAPGGRV